MSNLKQSCLALCSSLLNKTLEFQTLVASSDLLSLGIHSLMRSLNVILTVLKWCLDVPFMIL